VLRTGLVAVPTADRGARAAYLVILRAGSADPVAFSTYVDARDGSILVRDDLVDWDVDNPEWEVFPDIPPRDYSSTDTRARWCFGPGAGCDEVVGTPASPLAWDVDPATESSTNTTGGNNAIAVHNDRGPQLVQQRPVHRRDRDRDPASEPRLRLPLDQPVAGGVVQPGHDLHLTAGQ
jgi:extracellular elastinolytic metalloproteinase